MAKKLSKKAAKSEAPVKEEIVAKEEKTTTEKVPSAAVGTEQLPKGEEVFNEGGLETQTPASEPGVDTVHPELTLEDKVKSDIPAVDEVENEPSTDPLVEESPYDEDFEIVTPVKPGPAQSGDEEWVADPALLVKVKGYRDTLNGTLYFGVRKK